MKIKELHLRNIASIEKADIDFEKDLNDAISGIPAGIFLISGDTGAGKSVILDGISMALYKKTPRINDVKNVNNNAYTNSLGEKTNVNSIEQYTRLGISHKDDCYSEVVFEGNDGRTYHARISLGISKGKTNKEGIRPLKYRDVAWEVKVGDNDWTKVDRSGQPILDAVGLTFEQFGRMAMLAQGQFAAFLTGDKKERESILEQLTNTAHFTKYGVAIKSLYDKYKKEKEFILQEFNLVKQYTLSPEEVEKLTGERQEYEKQKKEKDAQNAQNECQLKLVESILSYQRQIEIAERKLSELEETLAGDEFRQKKTFVEQWDATIEERQRLNEKQKAEQERKKMMEKIPVLQQAFHQLSADLLHRKGQMQTLQEFIGKEEAWLAGKGIADELYTRSGEVKTKLVNLIDDKKSIEKLVASINELKAMLPALDKKVAEKEAVTLEWEKKLKEKEEEIHLKNQELRALNLEQINKDMALTNERLGKLNHLKTSFANNESSLKEIDELHQDIQKEEKQLKEISGQIEEAEQAYALAKKEDDKARNRLITMQMSVEETLVNLRRRMQEEQTDQCPLCGQFIQELHLDEEFREMLTPLQADQKDTGERLEEAEKKREGIVKEYNRLKGKYDSHLTQHTKKQDAYDKLQKQLLQEAHRMGIDTTAPLSDSLENEIKQAKTDLATYQESQEKAIRVQKNIEALNKEKKPLEVSHRTAMNDKNTAVNERTVKANTLQSYEEQEKELTLKISEIKRELQEILAGHYPSWEDNLEDTNRKLQQDADEYLQRKKKLEADRERYQQDQKLMQTLSQTQEKLLALYPDWSRATSPAPVQTRDISFQWTQLYGNLNTLSHQLQDSGKTIDQTTAFLNDYYERTGHTEELLIAIESKKDRLNHIRKEINDLETEWKTKKESIKDYRGKIEESMEQLGIEQLEQLPDKSGLEETKATLNQEILQIAGWMGGIDEQLKKNDSHQEQLMKLEKQLEKATQIYYKWEKLNHLFGGTNFRTLVQTYILRPLLNNANIYLQKITDRYTLTCSEQNEQLSILVLDRYNKNQIRSVTVLSGGERFMISLSLSLALSSLNRPDMNVNILFIDEGFGTLDEKSLDSVMSTLEKLQEIAGQGNRRVGIISHREELDERIPVQIRVRKKGEGRSHVEIKNN